MSHKATATERAHRAEPRRVPAVGYLRRSTDKQEASIAEQTAAVQRYADDKGYRILRWYTDDGISGDDTEKRHAFQEMVADAQQLRDFEAIVCWDQSRFGRFDSIEAGYWIHPLRRAGVHLATVADGVIDWTEPSGRIVGGVNQEGKHQWLLDHSRNVARGQRGAAESGSWTGSPPYAYRVVGERKQKRLVLDDPAKVRIVQRIFREFVEEGRSMMAIAKRLNDEGIISPGGRVKGWRFDAVKVILENPAYCGDFMASRFCNGKYHTSRNGSVVKANGRCRKPEAEWVVRRDYHQPIIDRATWEKAQAIFAERKQDPDHEGPHPTGRGRHAPEESPYILAGLLRCGRCGCALWGTDSRKFKYFECSNRKYNGPDACEGTTVREDAVLKMIGEKLENFLEIGGEPIDCDAIGTAAFYGALQPGDLPPAFAKVRALVAPPARPKADRKRLEKHAEQLKATLAKARANLVLLDAAYIPAGQETIRCLEGELADTEQALRESKPPAEKDVNAVALEVMHSLYSLAACCRIMARPPEPGWVRVGSLESAAPAAVRKFLGRTSQIVVHTDKRGKGTGTRHVLEGGEIVFRGVGGATGNLNPHRTG